MNSYTDKKGHVTSNFGTRLNWFEVPLQGAVKLFHAVPRCLLWANADDSLGKELELVFLDASKRGCGEGRSSIGNASLAAGGGKKRGNLFSKNPFAFHARLKLRVVQLAATNRPDPI